MDLELKNVSVYNKDLYWMLKALAKLILSRCLQKVLIRNYFKSNEKESFNKCLES